MHKLMRTLALVAGFALLLPAIASADGWHGHGHRYHYRGPCAPRVVYAPRPHYAAPVYAAPVYPAPIVYAPVPRPVFVAPAPVAVFPPAISVRTPHVAVTIGGWFPF